MAFGIKVNKTDTSDLLGALNSTSKKGSKMSNYDNESPLVGTRTKTDL